MPSSVRLVFRRSEHPPRGRSVCVHNCHCAMQLIRVGLILVSSLLISGTVAAGVYNPGESDEAATYPDFINGPPGKDFREVVMTLRIIPLKQPEVDKPVRRR